MAEKHSEQHIIASYEVDSKQILRPTALLDWMQEAAGRNADTLGFGYDDLIGTGTTWVLSRTHVSFFRYPKWRDEVCLKTWHKGAHRLFYLRDFTLEDAAGERLAAATTSWVVIDVNTHRLVTSRNPELAESVEKCIKEDAIAEPADKVSVPTGVEPRLIGTHKVAWSDVDYVGHANNVKYLVWALDAIDAAGLYEGCELRDVVINYDAEVRKEQEVELYCTVAEEGVCYIQGKVAGRAHFSMKLTFAPCE